MSSDKRWVLSKIATGTGAALDLGGGTGKLAEALSGRGYRYVNMDLHPSGRGSKIVADAHRLPFGDATLPLVVSSDTLEHFSRPDDVLHEVARVLAPDGRLVIWVPFMHPFHGDDLYRYTPLALRAMLNRARLDVVSIEAPLWV